VREEFVINLPRPRDINSTELAEYASRIMRSLKGFKNGNGEVAE
jgi:hypothetical protein